MAFSDNVWWTRKARIQAEKRLLANSFQSQVLLLWYSFANVAASIYHLKISGSPSGQDLASVSWIVFSVLVLCIAGFINGLSFKERAGLIKECYETLNSFYQKAKKDSDNTSKLSAEYEQILGLCENHTDIDYYRALCIEHVTAPGKPNKETGFKNGLDRCPTFYHWACVIQSKFYRLILLSGFYVFPIIVFIVLKYLP